MITIQPVSILTRLDWTKEEKMLFLYVGSAQIIPYLISGSLKLLILDNVLLTLPLPHDVYIVRIMGEAVRVATVGRAEVNGHNDLG